MLAKCFFTLFGYYRNFFKKIGIVMLFLKIKISRYFRLDVCTLVSVLKVFLNYSTSQTAYFH